MAETRRKRASASRLGRGIREAFARQSGREPREHRQMRVQPDPIDVPEVERQQRP